MDEHAKRMTVVSSAYINNNALLFAYNINILEYTKNGRDIKWS